MVQDRVGPAGRVLAANIERIRKRQGMSYVELAIRTEELGQPIPALGLRRIERGERRVDFDDLLILARALDVYPVTLMVPFTGTDTVPFPVGDLEVGCETARDWISGRRDLEPRKFAQPQGVVDIEDLPAILQWLPEDRRRAVIKQWVNEQYDDVNDAEDRHQ